MNIKRRSEARVKRELSQAKGSMKKNWWLWPNGIVESFFPCISIKYFCLLSSITSHNLCGLIVTLVILLCHRTMASKPLTTLDNTLSFTKPEVCMLNVDHCYEAFYFQIVSPTYCFDLLWAVCEIKSSFPLTPWVAQLAACSYSVGWYLLLDGTRLFINLRK